MKEHEYWSLVALNIQKADAVVIFSYHLCTSLFPLIIIMIPVSQEFPVTVSSLATSVIIMIHSAKEPRSCFSNLVTFAVVIFILPNNPGLLYPSF